MYYVDSYSYSSSLRPPLALPEELASSVFSISINLRSFIIDSPSPPNNVSFLAEREA
jgi:hypothetical protein